ncbi:MAG TPA: UDP-N-acetylmuramoyl-L-alanyl-D-glutamate--2,6-diaminopimelate ligase [Tissierellales bacterium]|nr:UDP-N-acetylmuramoyl-L-alanyl-D-glutamate--2,6-diaminopimelate ligase [Tissierellales bacterium]
MKLKNLIKNIDVKKIIGSLDLEITGINHDSREIKPGDLFVAIEGFNVDGHDFLNEVGYKGAKAVIVEKDVTLKEDITIIKVEDTRIALAELSSVFLGEPSKKMEVIGVTGTNGKTTITYLIRSIFEENNKKAGVIGTNGNIINGKLYETENTTPESLALQKNFYEMARVNTDICIMEVSSHSLDMKRVENTDFNIGVFTNLTEEHLDYHNTMDEYFNSKLKLFYMTKDVNIINIDDTYGKFIIEKVSKEKANIITYGITNEADIFATDIVYNSTGVSFKLNTPKDSINIELNIPGEFSVYNALAAASCGFAYSIDLKTIKAGLEKVKGVKGRFEIVPTNRDFAVIIDFAHTADSLEKTLTAIDKFAEGRKVVVFGAGGNRDKTKRPIMGETVAKHADLSIVTSDNPRDENPEKIIQDVIKGIEKVKGDYVYYVDRKDAIRYALENAKPKDIILLAGKGHETYTIIKDKVIPFDERKIVLDILKGI